MQLCIKDAAPAPYVCTRNIGQPLCMEATVYCTPVIHAQLQCTESECPPAWYQSHPSTRLKLKQTDFASVRHEWKNRTFSGGGAKHTDPSYMGSLPPILQDLLPWLSGLRDPLTSLSTTISRLPHGPYKERWWHTLVSYYLSDANGLSWLCTHHLPAYKPRLFACVNTQLNIKWPVTSNSVLNLLS